MTYFQGQQSSSLNFESDKWYTREMESHPLQELVGIWHKNVIGK